MKQREERGRSFFSSSSEAPDKSSEVFFNPEMRTNRDISEVAAKVFLENSDVEDPRICDACSGSGIRGFRYAGIADELHLNDPNPDARDAIEKGLEENDIEAEVHGEDANVLLSRHRNFFHIIDVDPFGPFTKFLDSTVRAANHNSFVGLTATDNAAPSGSYKTVCRRRYGSRPLRNSFMHETGLRIYIREVFENFARFDKCFDPKMCFHERHYSRIMGRVTESKSRTNRGLDNIGYLSFCPECRWRELEKTDECSYCGNQDLDYAGPLWTGKIGDQRFTGQMLEETPQDWEKAREILKIFDSECQIRTPYYDMHEMASELDVQAPKRDKVIESLEEKGYMISRTHFAPTGLKTDAPFEDIRKEIRAASTTE